MTYVFRTFALGTALATSLAASASADDVTIRYLTSQGGLAAHELAQELGYFDGTGIKLENLGYASGGPETLMGLAGGSLDLASAATSAVLNSIAGGNDFVIAYANNGINEDVQSIFYVLDDSPIQSIEDIAGKTIAVNTLGAHLDYTVREALHQKGLSEDAANLVVVPGPQLEQVLRAGQVDIAAFGYWQTTFEGAAREHGGIRPIFDDTDVLGEIAGGFVVLRRDWVDAHPEQARVFVEQSARALDYARENPEETKAIFAKALEARGENPEVAQYFRGYGMREGGLPVKHDIQFWIDVFEREGQIPEGKLVADNLLLVTGDDAPGDELMAVSGETLRGEVTVRGLTQSFTINGQKLTVLDGLDLDVRSAEVLAIVGPSGSGKTTLLRVLAGFDAPDRGEVRIDGVPVHGVGTERAVIFQEPRLLPWLTVLGNVAFGLEVRGVPRSEAEARARRYVRLVGLDDFADAWPRQLSGGMAQRVGIARALTVQPEILLLDEPFGALDAMTKITMQEELARIWREEAVTMILVTHDLEEAIFLADRVLVLAKERGKRPRLIDVDLPRPRQRNEANFVAMRRLLMGEFGFH